MNKEELFTTILQALAEEWDLELLHPYGDGYFELYDNKTNVIFEGFNPDGSTLAFNLERLGKVAESLQ